MCRILIFASNFTIQRLSLVAFNSHKRCCFTVLKTLITVFQPIAFLCETQRKMFRAMLSALFLK